MSANQVDYYTLIIIGSPRSGTNMLRDTLVGLPAFGTWPCDEINYVWRHGNMKYPSDQFPVELARPEVVSYIRNQFDKRARLNSRPWIVEKTCANSLRVEFVDAVIPEARYLFIYRDGYDVVASAMKRWKAKLDIGYLLAKARFVPPADLSHYALRYIRSQLHRLYSTERRHAYWGPRLDGMTDLVKNLTLEEICALQWQSCIESSQSAFSRFTDPGKVMSIKYEDFVNNSNEMLGAICEFLGVAVPAEQLEAATVNVSSKSVGKGREELDSEEITRIESLIGSTLSKYGYN